MEDDYDSHKSCLLGRADERDTCDGGDDESSRSREEHTEMLTYTFNLISKSETDRIVDFLFLLLFYSNYLMNYSPVKHCE